MMDRSPSATSPMAEGLLALAAGPGPKAWRISLAGVVPATGLVLPIVGGEKWLALLILDGNRLMILKSQLGSRLNLCHE